jgi:hypothetical protein
MDNNYNKYLTIGRLVGKMLICYKMDFVRKGTDYGR